MIDRADSPAPPGLRRAPLLQACLNGGRTHEEHPAVPRTPEELARASRAAVEAGAGVLHLHPYDEAGNQTLAAEPCAAAIAAVRAACPGIPISLSTSADVEPDPDRRLALIAGWRTLPELVTANQGEEGIVELSEHLAARGVGIEAGLLALEDAQAFIASGIAPLCRRVLIEPLDAEPAAAVEHAAAMERLVVDAGIDLEQVHHGDQVAHWAVLERAIARGHGIRSGLEDTTLMPDGQRATDNGELVALARRMQDARGS